MINFVAVGKWFAMGLVIIGNASAFSPVSVGKVLSTSSGRLPRAYTGVPISIVSPLKSDYSIPKLALNLVSPTPDQDEEVISINEIEAGDDSSSPWGGVLGRPVLAGLDVLSLVIFAAVGKSSHSASGAFDLGAVLFTALPFLVSWFAISPIMGSFSPDATASLSKSFSSTARGWALAVPVGCALRGAIKGYIPPTPFIIVTLISTLVLLGGTRAAYTAISAKLQDTE